MKRRQIICYYVRHYGKQICAIHPIMITQLVRSQSEKRVKVFVLICTENVRFIIINQIRSSKWRKETLRSMAAHERGINMMGKPVYLHLNGDGFKRKRLVVNQRVMRDFESFLNAASISFRSPAREIRTPGGRHRIRTLDDLQRDCSYVVVGREPFKKIG